MTHGVVEAVMTKQTRGRGELSWFSRIWSRSVFGSQSHSAGSSGFSLRLATIENWSGSGDQGGWSRVLSTANSSCCGLGGPIAAVRLLLAHEQSPASMVNQGSRKGSRDLSSKQRFTVKRAFSSRVGHQGGFQGRHSLKQHDTPPLSALRKICLGASSSRLCMQITQHNN